MKPDISICIATFRRPAQLERLLFSLGKLNVQNFSFEIIIVDNDSKGSARNVAETMAKKYTELRYYVEPKQNIALARNLGVQKAKGIWIAFIDDDEDANPDWLISYWKICKTVRGDGYFGPVISQFDGVAPKWMKRDLFFCRPRFETGTRARIGSGQTRTGNAFIRRTLFDSYKFDSDFGLTGGEDSDIFIRMLHNGVDFYWCDEARVIEYIPQERLCLAWLIKRAFRSGITYTTVQNNYQNFLTNFCGLLKASLAILALTVLSMFEAFRGPTYFIKRLQHLAVQFGHIFGFFKIQYQEYKVNKMHLRVKHKVDNLPQT